MAKVYLCAFSHKKAPVVLSNMKKVYNLVNGMTDGAQIWHGTTAMESFRLRRVNNYAGFCHALELNGFKDAPFFFDTLTGVVSFTVSRIDIE